MARILNNIIQFRWAYCISLCSQKEECKDEEKKTPTNTHTHTNMNLYVDSKIPLIYLLNRNYKRRQIKQMMLRYIRRCRCESRFADDFRTFKAFQQTNTENGRRFEKISRGFFG